MNYIFYCIYNTQYLDGNNKKNKTPWFNALGMMMGGSFLWLSIIIEIFCFYIMDKNTPSNSISYVVVILLLLFYSHYLAFIKDKKYEEIYEEYKGVGSKLKEKWVAITYIFIPAITSMLIAMIWHKVI